MMEGQMLKALHAGNSCDICKSALSLSGGSGMFVEHRYLVNTEQTDIKRRFHVMVDSHRADSRLSYIL